MLRVLRASGEARQAGAFLEVTHAGARYRIAVKRVARARRFTLRVRAATLDAVLTMPSRASLRAARSFAERHAAWVGDRLQALPRRIPFAVGSVIPFRGEELPIVAADGLRRQAYMDEGLRPDGTTGPRLRVSGTAEEQDRRVVAFLVAEARRDIEAAVTRHTAALRRPARGLTIRDTRSRWGSCSARGDLNFSWRLVMAPPFVLDYLAAHEVAHLEHLDHSAAYWAVAARLAPDLDRAEAWLKAHGATLHRFGAAPARSPDAIDVVRAA